MSPIAIDAEYLLQTLLDLIRINSINPSLVANAPGEATISTYVAEALQMLGLTVHRHEPQPGRVSVAGMLKGNKKGRSLMLNAHSDTVGVDGMSDPFSPVNQDGKIFGRGSYDMKGSLAACMTAVKALFDANVTLKGDLLIAAVADEECASLGTADLIQRYQVDGAIVTEPTDLEICLAHKGFCWIEVETLGRAAHGSRFDEGIDANMRMGRFLARLETLERELRRRAPHHLLGPPSLHAAMIEGGTGFSTYSDHCAVKIERRTIPGETEDLVLREIEAIIQALSTEDATFKATAQVKLSRDPFEISQDANLVQQLQATSTEVLGEEVPYRGETPWMDSALLASAGIETVVLGPSGGGAHSAKEWVDLRSLEILAEILALTSIQYCH